MATYYRWNRNAITYEQTESKIGNKFRIGPYTSGFTSYTANSITNSGSTIYLAGPPLYTVTVNPGHNREVGGNYLIINGTSGTHAYKSIFGGFYFDLAGQQGYWNVGREPDFVGDIYSVTMTQKTTFLDYVYSTSSFAYPNGGESGDYYYDQRTTVTSPTAPTGLTYPNSITTPQVAVSWNTATSETDYPVSRYQLQYSINGGSSWTTVSSSITGTSHTATIPVDATRVRFRVRAQDSNNQVGNYVTGNDVTVSILPATPGSISAPVQAIEGTGISVNWDVAARATGYTLQRSTGSGWMQVYSGAETTFSETVGHWGSLQYRVQGTNSYGSSEWRNSASIPVYFSPTLTVPQMVMQGQQATISWSKVDGADSYTLQRKSSADTDWVQVYSGANLTFSETVETWTTVQYRVQAVFDGTPGGWAESAAIPVVSASSLVISGTDEDLGVVTNDIPYSISTDTGNQITATITVNNAVIFSGNVGNSTADVIPVLDLITGEGTIVISATVEASGSPVTATRTWTYEKAAITFPNSGSVAQVTKEGENIYPKVLAEGVRLPGGKTLDQVMGFPAQIYTGSYTGTGTSGASNLVTLTFPFDPKIVFITRETTPTGGSLGTITPMIKGVQQSIVGINGNSRSIAYLTWGNNSLSFYGNGGADTSLNESGINYYYVALG